MELKDINSFFCAIILNKVIQMNLFEQINKCEISIEDSFNLLNIKEIEPELLIVEGFKNKTYKINIDENSKNIIKSIEIKLNNKNLKVKPKLITKRKSIKLYHQQLNKGKNFLNAYFNLHDVYLLRNGYKLELSSPFNIFLSHFEKSFDDAGVESSFEEITKDNYQVVFQKISLPMLATNLLPSIYSHEIIHTQLISVFGSIDHFFNNEVIPIFIELLYNQNNEYTYIIRLNQLKDIIEKIDKNCILNNDTINNMLYYVSIITAYKLFNIYIKGNNLVKKEIINNIQSVFDNKFTLETLLDKYYLNWTKKRVIL